MSLLLGWSSVSMVSPVGLGRRPDQRTPIGELVPLKCTEAGLAAAAWEFGGVTGLNDQVSR